MSDVGQAMPGVANSDASPREDEGVADVDSMSRNRVESTASCGGVPRTGELLHVLGMRQNSGKRPPTSGVGGRALSALGLTRRVGGWEGSWSVGTTAAEGGDLLKMAKFGHVGSRGGPVVEGEIRTCRTNAEDKVDFPRRTALAGSACFSTGVRWRKRAARRREATFVGPL